MPAESEIFYGPLVGIFATSGKSEPEADVAVLLLAPEIPFRRGSRDRTLIIGPYISTYLKQFLGEMNGYWWSLGI